ncbi:MAG: D-glycero-beta-D-manno-heptose-7-phosphate kinase [Rhodospirillales bacterium]|nr:D-glycero-beta-D-manno-heptose-7-phosphate kinase [Rhodospirillales bacterium]
MTDRSSLIPLVEALANARVLIVGDVMLDHFVYGSVERISPEAPIPVLRIARETAMLGGAGNVARNVAALGGRVVLIGAIGTDVAGKRVRKLVSQETGVTDALLADKARRTSTKTRYFGGNQQMLRADEETVAPLAPRARKALLQKARQALRKCAVMVLSDYGKGVLQDGVSEALIAIAKRAGKPVVVDPKSTDYRCYRGADVITPNRRELADASGMATGTDAEVVAAAGSLIRKHALRAIIATRSQDGMTLVAARSAKAKALHLKAEAREVFDVSGAGDTVVATVAAALGAGAGLAQAAALANVTAGIVVGKVGTAVTHPAEVVAALHHQDLSSAEAKVLTLAQALERVEQWRRRDLSVGFTNGCFDLLHPGHVALLRQARRACDRLIVGLNSDASIARLKGPGRPVQPEAARAAVLASLAAVDAVVIFGDDTPLELIKGIRPDVLIKGAEYTGKLVVGAAEVRAYGGRVILADMVAGHSTTATIARMER